MPELVYPPAKPEAYPPIARIASGVTEHTVKYLPPRPGRNEPHGPPESFLDILKQYGDPDDPKSLTFAKLIEFNFGLTQGEPRYFEKINWFLKHKLNCKKTTEQGNFIFSTGEKIYIPLAVQVVPENDVPGIVAVRRKVGEVRWIRIARNTASSGGPQYEIPGVDQTSTPPETKAEAIAALVRFVAVTASSWVASEGVLFRLRSLEADLLKGGEGIGNVLQPAGKYEAVVVRVRLLASTEDSDQPKTIYGQPQVIGQGDVKNVLDIVDDFERPQRIEAGPPGKTTFVYEYYMATRMSKK